MTQEVGLLPYDYARNFDKENGMTTHIPETHYYEFVTNEIYEPFWEPASVEDELKNQLQHLNISPSGLL